MRDDVEGTIVRNVKRWIGRSVAAGCIAAAMMAGVTSTGAGGAPARYGTAVGTYILYASDSTVSDTLVLTPAHTFTISDLGSGSPAISGRWSQPHLAGTIDMTGSGSGYTWNFTAPKTVSGLGTISDQGTIVINGSTAGTFFAVRQAALDWTIQRTRNPASAVDATLQGVACPSPTWCVAVGYASPNGGGNAQLAEMWNGTKWTIHHLPTPKGSSTPTDSFLAGVSCISSTWCTAVGYNYGNYPSTLAEVWNGSTWKVERTAAGTGIFLEGVSCTSTTACTAVGYGDTGGAVAPLAEAWNGTTWTVQPTPIPTGSTYSQLLGVSCTSSTSCTAVGYATVGDQVPLIETWDGRTWTVRPSTNPAGSTATEFQGVSCPSTSQCTVVGYATVSGGLQQLVEVGNGNAWSVQAPPTGLGSNELHGVDCLSATACTAVGDGDLGPLAQVWNGTTWTMQSTPTSGTGLNQPISFYAVSCTTATVCTAVGHSTLGTLAERS